MWHIYTMEYYSAIENNKITPSAATWIHLEITLTGSKVNQTGEDKYQIVSLICGI